MGIVIGLLTDALILDDVVPNRWHSNFTGQLNRIPEC